MGRTVVFKLAIGIAAFFLYGITLIYANFSPISYKKVSAKLSEQVAPTIAGGNFSWADISFSGQAARVAGTAPSDEAVDELFFALRNSAGPGGPIFGGVTNVDMRPVIVDPSQIATELERPATLQIPSFNAEFTDTTLVVRGSAPGVEAHDALIERAASSFPDRQVIDNVVILRGGVVYDPAWAKAVTIGLDALRKTERGRLSVNGSFVTINGDVGSREELSDIKTLLGTLPPGYASSIGIQESPIAVIADVPTDNVPESTPASEPASDVEPALPTPAPTASAVANQEQPESTPSSCLDQVRSTTRALKISFNSAQSDISNREREGLTSLASLLRNCPTARISIIGHTDSSGSAVRNRALSIYRADSVVAFLKALGVNADQLASEGAGESAPIVSNATQAGRAQNRRIEITLENE